MEKVLVPLIPFDVWPIVASFSTPYLYHSLCLTNRTIQQSIRHLKNDFFKESSVIQRWYSGYEMTVTVVDFGEGSDRTDLYIDDNDCISLRGITNTHCVFKHYAIEWHSFYGVFNESGIVCIVRPGEKVCYREECDPRFQHSDFEEEVNVVITQMTRNPGVVSQDTKYLCAAMLINNGRDIVATIMALTNNV